MSTPEALRGTTAGGEVNLASGALRSTRDTSKQPTSTPFASRMVDVASRGVVQALLIVLALFWLVPTVGLLVDSFRPEADNDATGWWAAFTHLDQFTLDNYKGLVQNSDIIHSFYNSFYITVPATILVVIVASLAGYAFAWISFPGRDALFLVVIGLLVVPLQVGLIPVAKLYNVLGIYGSIWGVIFYHVAFGLPFAVFLLRNFFAGIPRDLLEAARMDGATETRIFRKVILPLGLPAIASLAIFQFLWTWNDLLIGLIFADAGSHPLTVAIREQTRQFGNSISVLSSASFLSMSVPLVVFFAFQRYFVQGVLAGSVK